MKWWVKLAFLAIPLALTAQSFAAESLRVGGQPQVQLQFRIVIPQILSLQIGSEDDLALEAAGLNTAGPRRIPVKAAGAVPGKQPIVLTANWARPSADGARTISLEEAARGGGGLNQRVDYWRGSGNKTGMYPLSSPEQPQSNNRREVLYTLSCP